jgi:hypothetical protein
VVIIAIAIGSRHRNEVFLKLLILLLLLLLLLLVLLNLTRPLRIRSHLFQIIVWKCGHDYAAVRMRARIAIAKETDLTSGLVVVRQLVETVDEQKDGEGTQQLMEVLHQLAERHPRHSVVIERFSHEILHLMNDALNQR